MIKIKITAVFILMAGQFFCAAQGFIYKGAITYERKIQMHKLLSANSWFKGNLDNIPKFYSSQFQLRFNPDTTYYTKTSEDEPNSASWAVYAKENEVISLLSANQSITKMTIWNDNYTIRDSLVSYKWKLVSETRKIAGVECRKATTIIHDSIYIIAFYAENILVSGGPEQFNGLPGMILGIVIPRLHVSYYAQKIEGDINQSINLPKQKTKSFIGRREFTEMILKNLKWAFTNSGFAALYLFI